MPRRFDALLSFFAAVVICAGPLRADAQTHRVTTHGPVTRAVAVYEWTGELVKPTAARLVPVSLFIDGRFEDAGTYLARPIPLALLNENVYSLEKSGVTEGTLTVAYARHLQAATSAAAVTADSISDYGWFGYGKFTPLPAEKPVQQLTATMVHGITSSKEADSTPDKPLAGEKDHPSFGRNSAEKTAPAASAPPPAVEDDPDRPHLSKSAPPKSAPATDTPATAPGDVDGGTPAASTGPERKTDTSSATPPESETDRPTLRHRDPKQAEADRKARDRGSLTGMGNGPGSDPDRPQMRRGAVAGAGATPTQLSGLPATLHQVVAVSDAETRPVHGFRREWDTAQEKADTEAKLTQIALAQVAAFDRAEPGAAPVTAPSGKRAGHATHKAAAAAAVSFAQTKLDGFQLEYSGLPTFVLQAETAPGTAGMAAARFVTVVVQRLPTGEMQTALATVTDALHLDRTAQFRLVDAVDADASNRASLLFELRGQSTRQFALYKLTGARAETVFVSNPSE